MTQPWTWIALVFVGVVVLVPLGMVLGAAIGEKLFSLFADERASWPMDDSCLAGPPELDQSRDLLALDPLLRDALPPPSQWESVESTARPPSDFDR
ncbi:MAG TPA: hypothetical protein VH008_18010 [Pseudonocardia sp.]|jgi:hypothetical protein|nr:hypothetical protein [Pseudonocardia sp.]